MNVKGVEPEIVIKNSNKKSTNKKSISNQKITSNNDDLS